MKWWHIRARREKESRVPVSVFGGINFNLPGVQDWLKLSLAAWTRGGASTTNDLAFLHSESRTSALLFPPFPLQMTSTDQRIHSDFGPHELVLSRHGDAYPIQTLHETDPGTAFRD